LIKTNLFTDS